VLIEKMRDVDVSGLMDDECIAIDVVLTTIIQDAIRIRSRHGGRDARRRSPRRGRPRGAARAGQRRCRRQQPKPAVAVASGTRKRMISHSTGCEGCVWLAGLVSAPVTDAQVKGRWMRRKRVAAMPK
jgi:hypothetical protein